MRRALLPSLLALLLPAAALCAAGPSLALWQDRREKQQTAESYVRSLGLPLYPHMVLVDRLHTSDTELDGLHMKLTRAAFRSRDDFDAARTSYAQALAQPRWAHTESSVRGIGENWEAQRTVGATTTAVHVSAPAGEGFVAVLYSVITTSQGPEAREVPLRRGRARRSR